MKTKLLTFALLLMGVSAGAQTPVSVSISDDCSQNGKKIRFGRENGYTWVDLGLSVKWATMNVGATAPEDYGYYFAWGETAEKKDYSWSTYKYCNGTSTTMTKYCTDSSLGTVDNKTTLEAEDDAAHVKWGGTWRMPTDAEWTELRGQCTWEWTTQNDINGYLVTSKKAGYTTQSIFLPASGWRSGTDLYDVGSGGSCWSSSLYEGDSDYACRVGFNSNDVGGYYGSRSGGRSVRPVCQNVSATDYYTLTLYADGCDAPNTFICDAGQQLSVSATPMEHRHFVKWNDGNTDNPRLVTLNQNLTHTASFEDDFTIQVGCQNGKVTGADSYYKPNEKVVLTAIPDFGYHFVQWSDRVTDNPRTIYLVSDTAFTAIFAPDTFNISLAVYPANYGSVNGAGRYPYKAQAVLTATPDYGYEFSQWSDGNTDNPRTIYVTSDCSFQAIFTKKQFNLQGMTTDDSQGYVSGGGSFFYQDNVTIKANSYVGYAFLQWNDGNVENPRTIYLVSDTAFTASFYQLYEGKCGDDLSWKYADNTLTITGMGAMYDYTSSSMPWLLLRDSITKVIVPDACTSIGSYAFQGCSGLTSITIPNSVTSIGDYAFSGCEIKSVIWNAKNSNGYNFGSQVESFVFGDSVQVIPDNICKGMSKLTSITIPNSVTSIGNNAFSGCSGIDSVIWNAKNCNSYNFGSQVESFVFGDSVQVIPNNICKGMSNITSITIPSSVQSIGNNAFQNCTGISELNINNGVTSIGDYAFFGLSDKNLKTIALPNSVETIGKYAFAECSYLKTITLGAKLEDIDEYAFQNDERLIYVNCYAEEPPLLQENAFVNYDIYLQVPCEVLDEYKVAKGWKLFNKANVSCLSAEGKTVTSDQITVTPSANNATFTWPANDAADCYKLEITKDGAVFCTLKFNAQGQLIGIAFAPGRNGNHHAPAAVMTTNGWQFTVTGLNAASHYNYTLDVTDAGKQSIKKYTGEFATDGYTDLLSLPYEGKDGIGSKFIHNGLLYILRDGIMYDARGVRIE